jgi:hypothetical protein
MPERVAHRTLIGSAAIGAANGHGKHGTIDRTARQGPG